MYWLYKLLSPKLHSNLRKAVFQTNSELKHEKDVASTLTKQIEHFQKTKTPLASPSGHNEERKKIEELGTKFDEALSHSLMIKEERIALKYKLIQINNTLFLIINQVIHLVIKMK